MTAYTNTRQSEWTALTAACGHPTQARLSLDAEQAAYEIFTILRNLCIPCAIKQRHQTRGICWADVNGGR